MVEHVNQSQLIDLELSVLFPQHNTTNSVLSSKFYKMKQISDSQDNKEAVGLMAQLSM